MSRYPERPDSVAAEAKRAQRLRAKPCRLGCKRMPGLDCRACIDRVRQRVPELY